VSLVAHLKHGSIRVKSEDHVSRGEVLALCGNSGNSSGKKEARSNYSPVKGDVVSQEWKLQIDALRPLNTVVGGTVVNIGLAGTVVGVLAHRFAWRRVMDNFRPAADLRSGHSDQGSRRLFGLQPFNG
jgi:hypothetical protein